MISPFDNILFKYWNTGPKEDDIKRAEFLKANPPSIQQIVEWVADIDSGRDVVDKLYYVYGTEALHSLIGWHVQPGNFGVGGLLKLPFYEKLIQALDPKYFNHLFPFLPKELQTDEMLISFVQDKNVKDNRIGNYHGDTLKTSTLEWLIDNALSTVPQWKKEWWTPALKARAIAKDTASIAYMPNDIYDKEEIRQFLIKDGLKSRSHIRELWYNLPESFKMDPEIFARWLILNGGLANNFNEINGKKFFNLEGMKMYFKLLTAPVFGEWKFIRKDWKKDLIDVAIPMSFGAVALDPDIPLTDEILDKTLNSQLNEMRKARIAHRLQKESRLTKELIKRMKLKYSGIGSLTDNELYDLYQNSDIIDHLIEIKDEEFLHTKTNWPKGVKIKREYFINMVIALNYSKAKITSRFKGVFTEDDYVWIYFESNKLEKKTAQKIKTVLSNMNQDGLVKVSKETLKLLSETDETSTYDAFKAATDIFLF